MSNLPVIDKGIPLPRREVRTKLGLERMVPEDSIALGNDKPAAQRAHAAAAYLRKRDPNWKFTVRITEDGYRIWCLSSPNKGEGGR